MITGFEKIVEERIKAAQKKGDFENLEGSGNPIRFTEDRHIPEELRLSHKILKNADCLPPEIEIKKQIQQTEELLDGMDNTASKYKLIKKINYLIMKLNTIRGQSALLDEPQYYHRKLLDKFEQK